MAIASETAASSGPSAQPAGRPWYAQRLFAEPGATFSPLQGALAFVFMAAQLAVLTRLLIRYEAETPNFRNLVPWLVAGFAVHHWTPRRFQLQVFAALSIGSIFFVFGMRPAGWDTSAALLSGGAVVGIGVALIGICHLPVSWRLRIGLLCASMVALGCVRVGVVKISELAPALPVLASMFMFRMIIYVYDQQHATTRPTIAQSLSYFFMLPNVVFPLFPVVDWKTFTREWFNGDPFRIYQQGLQWIARGVVQLVLYRVVYYHLYVDGTQVVDGTTLMRYVFGNFALYLRVSGQFHMIVGMLHLFGFNLPEGNHHYFLADSFTDYWRRVNIYWKDFMMKLFYNPVAFRMKARGPVAAVVTGTAAAFAATWALHQYQSFWMRGGLFFTSQDTAFWVILGICVMVTAARETSHGRRRTLSKKINVRAIAESAVKTMLVFTLIALLWSIWSSTSWKIWLGVWKHADLAFFGWLLALLLTVGVFKVGVELATNYRSGIFVGTMPKNLSFMGLVAFGTAFVVIPSVVLWGLSGHRIAHLLDHKTAAFIAGLRANKPNDVDLAKMERGYYEQIFDAAGADVQPNGFEAPPGWVDFLDIPLLVPTGTLRYYDLKPSQHLVINGNQWTTNKFGLRDQEYEAVKPPNTYRIAMLGSSHVMGWGTDDGKTFDAIAEKALLNKRADGKKVEILNFGLGGRSPICQFDILEAKAFPLQPDAVWFISHSVDASLNVERFARIIREKVPFKEPFLQSIVDRIKPTPGMTKIAIENELQNYSDELLAYSYKHIVDISRAHGATPVFIYMPRVVELSKDKISEPNIALAKKAGFITMTLDGIWDDVPMDKRILAPWDFHPSAYGYELLGKKLAKDVLADPRMGFDKK